ncbi:MAG: hypothetical protein IH589_20810 [Anaerolineales bacterium]|nr:hypothetical protein [Anaerolineales bacterium]
MSDENADVVQPEKPSVAPQVVPQEIKPQEKTPEIKQVDLSESFTKNAGDQGISLNPVGSQATNPFTAQDIVQSQPPAQVVTPTPSAEIVTPPPPAQSSGGSDAGE